MKTSCTIIISHYESLAFLRTCVRQIRKYAHPDIKQFIIVPDQSGDATHSKVVSEFGDAEDICISWIDPLYSGYGIDYVMQTLTPQTEYICQLHVDAFPVHKNWLYMCIKLIEEYNYSFVGQNHFETNSTQSNYYYLKNMFFSMSPTFNVAKTKTYQEMSYEAGFTRYHERGKMYAPIHFKNNDWTEWAKHDYQSRGSDDVVVAFCWEGNHKETDKLGLALTGMLGIPPEAGYGRLIDDIVFHFGFCCESVGVEEQMGKRYLEWKKRINECFDDSLIMEMISLAKQNFSETPQRKHWDGKLKASCAAGEQLNKKIEELKSYNL